MRIVFFEKPTNIQVHIALKNKIGIIIETLGITNAQKKIKKPYRKTAQTKV